MFFLDRLPCSGGLTFQVVSHPLFVGDVTVYNWNDHHNRIYVMDCTRVRACSCGSADIASTTNQLHHTRCGDLISSLDLCAHAQLL